MVCNDTQWKHRRSTAKFYMRSILSARLSAADYVTREVNSAGASSKVIRLQFKYFTPLFSVFIIGLSHGFSFFVRTDFTSREYPDPLKPHLCV